ncbi:MAG: ComEC family competence protein [Cytophagaceae bacterium]|jgi:competence protein ComEC|nr:ComEC family competence protein [Cytophagaceae bacterium]
MNHFFWTKYPFVQVGFGFIGGNLLAYTFTDLPDFILSAYAYKLLLTAGITMALVVLFILFYFYKKRIHISGLLLFLLFVCLGSIRFLTSDERNQWSYPPTKDITCATAVIGEVVTEPEQKNTTINFLLRVQQIQQANQWIPYRFTMKVTLADTSWRIQFKEIVYLKGALTKPLKAETPFDFSYTRFLAHQNVYYTTYVKTKPLILDSSGSTFSPKYYAIKARQQLESLLTKKIQHKRAYALVTGLLIGKRSDLEETDKQLFTTSGTIHVLAVSGMHVVLIYQCLSFIAFLLRLRQHGIAFNLIILLLIWFYIFITGLQASASRAAIMITLVLLSKIVQRDNQNTNSLFATAFLMLLYNPYYLADAGFILSFLAVAGILIASSLDIQESTNKIMAYLLNALLISTAAQTATFPYSVHLFHQFPVYFLLANLIVVPLTTVLLFLAVILLFVYDVPYLNELLVLLIEGLTDGLFYILQLISYLPHPTITRISLSTVELILLYAGLLMVILLFTQRQVKWLWGISVSLTLLCGSLHYRMITHFHQPALLVSGKKDQRQYLFSCGHEAWVLQYKQDVALQRAADLFITEQFIKEYQLISIKPQCSFILQQGSKRVGVWRKKSVQTQPKDDFFENCEVLLLDYTIKSSYLDPNNKPIPNQKIFSLHGKKSFYSMTSSYELDTD